MGKGNATKMAIVMELAIAKRKKNHQHRRSQRDVATTRLRTTRDQAGATLTQNAMVGDLAKTAGALGRVGAFK